MKELYDLDICGRPIRPETKELYDLDIYLCFGEGEKPY